MNMALADEQAWDVNNDARVHGLQVVLLKRVYVLPWAQFLYAEGTSDEVRAAFSTHDVLIKRNDSRFPAGRFCGAVHHRFERACVGR